VTNASATRTGLRYLEKSAGADHLTPTAANGTIDAARSGLSSISAAFGAGIQFPNFDFLFRAKRGFLERDLHVVTQIRAPLSIFGMTGDSAKERFENAAANSAPSSAAENFAENIERIVKRTAKTATLFKGSVTEAIVCGAFVRIHQNVVGLTQLLKFLFGMRVVRIFVRMKFDREFAIRAFDLLFRGPAADSENFVVIAFSYCCHQ
jgi:hypothetical protein